MGIGNSLILLLEFQLQEVTPSANPHAVNQYAAKATFSTELLHGNVPEAPSEASFGLA
jgi:hypothetical protein